MKRARLRVMSILGQTFKPAPLRDWEVSKRGTDKYLAEISAIVGPYLIVPATVYEDKKQATDLRVLNLAPVRIACRVRRYEILERYGDEFTLRSFRPMAAPTELQKIISGWTDYLFYGYADQQERHLAAWWFLDMHVLRATYVQHLLENGGRPMGREMPNPDGLSSFTAFRIVDFPPELVVGCQLLGE